ncbi:hypothetical protein I302_100759 [Kwoniella bestiolae CBS 10118]|uniref:Uncharacterized protein n=1 Tax=Kwoniella bestiolae CBS 10118 TaxID=1296100 RepID=A0A1B9G5Y9_9TREE|nr:hypothetical protein I302_04132 [Kwoniella bestiolae CBS 10118]OCF26447.1 hypothetical protein I302_04132 [Kwoniella bestiolae CBS 10118]
MACVNMRLIMKSLQSHFTPTVNREIAAFENSFPDNTYQVMSMGDDPRVLVFAAYYCDVEEESTVAHPNDTLYAKREFRAESDITESFGAYQNALLGICGDDEDAHKLGKGGEA